MNLDPGGSLSFAITSFNTGEIPSLSVTNFNAQAVPAPLPAAGAASAFGFSRRIRRRIKKGHAPGAIRITGRRASDPSAYLNLSPSVLKKTSLSFSYPILPPPDASSPTSAVSRASAPMKANKPIALVPPSSELDGASSPEIG